ncbi:MAG: efflux RND transporter periplasmic adaptor subunit [Chloroflexi bacterium]|nr:efflux RND transporter periplasmic adaptor subunit [Chloroflexota bacterium]
MTKRMLGGAMLAAPALLLAACGAPPASQPVKTVISVAETPAQTGTIASQLGYSGSVTPAWTVSVLPQTSGQITDLRIHVGQRVNQGDVLAVLDHRSQDDQVTQAQANLTSAQAKLNAILAGARPEDVAAANANAAAAQAAVSDLQSGRPEAVAQAQAALDAAKQKLAQAQAGGRTESVAQAQAKLNADQAALDKLNNGPVPQDIANAKLAVEQAKDRLYADQTLDDAQVARGQLTKDQRQAQLDVDQTAIDQANTQLNKLVSPPRPEDLAQAKAAVDADKQALAIAQQPNTGADLAQLQAAVAQAQTGLDQARQPGSAAAIQRAQQQANAAKADAAKAANPYTTDDVAQARAAVDVAQASLQSAQTGQSNGTVTAPAAAIVSEVPVAVGSLVSAQSPIATLISPDLDIDASVEQSQVTQLKEGQPAQISVGSGSQIPGSVTQIAPAADTKTRKFDVKVRPTQTDNPLRAGMSASVSIQTGQQSNAILVPKDAVIQRNGQQIVFTDENGRAKMNTVQTGLSNDKQVQIISGVSAGAQVILPGSLNLADGDAVSAAPGPGISSSTNPSASAPAASSTAPSTSASPSSAK